MALNRRDRLVLALAGVFALGMPLTLLLGSGARDGNKVPPAPAPLRLTAPPALSAAYDRPLFGGPAVGGETAPSADAPQLAGIVGRLGQDAVALVRSDGAPTRALRIGESIDGWQLASLAIDAAFFTRGSERIRVPLPSGDEPQ
jgi:hypothetical protein